MSFRALSADSSSRAPMYKASTFSPTWPTYSPTPPPIDSSTPPISPAAPPRHSHTSPRRSPTSPNYTSTSPRHLPTSSRDRSSQSRLYSSTSPPSGAFLFPAEWRTDSSARLSRGNDVDKSLKTAKEKVCSPRARRAEEEQERQHSHLSRQVPCGQGSSEGELVWGLLREIQGRDGEDESS